MVAAYYVADVASSVIREQIRSIITIDSPILGFIGRNPLSDCLVTAQSWQDILGESSIVRSIESIKGTDLAEKLLHLNSTDIGNSLLGGRVIELECNEQEAVLGGALGGILGAIITGGWGAIVGAIGGGIYGEYGPGHACGFYDPVALDEIVNVLR